MSWNSKLGLIAIPLFLALNAWGQRIEFNRGQSKATVESHLLERGTTASGIELNLTVPYVDVERAADGFQSVNVNGLVPLSTPGLPEVGVTGNLIAVPAGYEPELTIVEQKTHQLDGVVVQPAQRKLRCGGEYDGFSYSAALYESKATFPVAVAKLEEVGKLQSLRLVRVALNPIQTNFATRSTTITTDLTVRVNFRKTSDAVEAPVVMSKSFYQLARGLTANGYGMGTSLRASSAPEVMVIVTADSLKSELSTLIQWKNQRGIETKVYTYTEAGGSKEAVKTFIQKLYDTHDVKPTYLLMVGNKDTMPSYMEATGSGSAASDWQYSLLTGSDNVPDAFYGRLVADNANDLRVQVSRWIDYEKAPEQAGGWYHDAMTIASPDGSGPSDKEYAEQIQGFLKAHTYKNADNFFASEQQATAKNITTAALDGRSWIAYFGHGSGTSWASTNDSFSNTQVAALKNTRLPFIIDVACQNASWVKLPKCFGKAWVTQVADGKNAGAVAFYGGSVNISWHPPAVMSVGVAKYHFEKGIPTLGGSVLAGQLYLVEKMGTGSDTLDNLKWYNLMGDPSLQMRTNTPKTYSVKQQLASNADQVNLTVTATDEQGAGVAGLSVSVSLSNRGVLGVGTTGTDGKAVISMSAIGALEPDTLVTVSGYNAETQQLTAGN